MISSRIPRIVSQPPLAEPGSRVLLKLTHELWVELPFHSPLCLYKKTLLSSILRLALPTTPSFRHLWLRFYGYGTVMVMDSYGYSIQLCYGFILENLFNLAWIFK